MEENGSPAVVELEDYGYEVIKMGGEGLGCRMMKGTEEAWAAFHFNFMPALSSMVGDT
jgi:hypothetical protein